MADFKKLKVWRKAHELALKVNHVAAGIRGPTHSALRSQMVRAAMSIASNIVEGRGQKTDREFARFLRISLNSTSELEYHLIVAYDFGVVTHRVFEATQTQLSEVRKMLHGILRCVEGENAPREKSSPAPVE